MSGETVVSVYFVLLKTYAGCGNLLATRSDAKSGCLGENVLGYIRKCFQIGDACTLRCCYENFEILYYWQTEIKKMFVPKFSLVWFSFFGSFIGSWQIECIFSMYFIDERRKFFIASYSTIDVLSHPW